MTERVYLETTVVSYLTSWPSRDIVHAAHQRITREWWDEKRPHIVVFVSEAVLKEAMAGDAVAARERMAVMDDIPLLEITQEVGDLAQRLITSIPLPERAAVDALHIAVATVHRMDYLLTWNCLHIANATLRKRIEAICRASGYVSPVICTPEELMEET